MVEEDRVVCIRFGHDYDQDCMAMDESLYSVSEKVQNFCVIYLGKPGLNCQQIYWTGEAEREMREGEGGKWWRRVLQVTEETVLCRWVSFGCKEEG